MEPKMVIRGIVSQGFWDADTESFRGIIFATYYENDGSWYSDLVKATKKDWCEVVEIYKEQN